MGWGGGGWGDIHNHIDINMNIDIHIIINMNIENSVIYYLFRIAYISSLLDNNWTIYYFSYSMEISVPTPRVGGPKPLIHNDRSHVCYESATPARTLC